MTEANGPAAACAVYKTTKNYGGVQALTGVDLEVYPGRVHAIVGENGAGKSTLMKILAGAEQPDTGEVYVAGGRVSFRNVNQANEHGVAIVFQELSLFPDLDILANMFVLHAPCRLGLIDRAEMQRRALPILKELGLEHMNLQQSVGQLPLGEQQLVEIAKALLADSKVLILDEPNSALNAAETERLFAIIRRLRDLGVAIIYISHRLEEVFQIADVITVMRNGEIVKTLDVGSTTIPEIVALMIGRQPSEFYSDRVYRPFEGAPLRLEHVTVAGKLYDVSFTAARGEIVGLAGLEGSGVACVLDVIFGLRRPDKGHVTLPNGARTPRTINAAVRSSIALIPADRRNDGLMLDQDIVTNVAQVTAGVLGRLGFFLQRRAISERAQARSASLHIKANSITTPVNHLSGGNQQKVVLAKWLEADPTVVLLNDPTRGVDVGAKEEIYRIVQSLADDGRIVVFVSSELPEYVHLCDRVLVFYRGRMCGEITRQDLNNHRLLEAINTGIV